MLQTIIKHDNLAGIRGPFQSNVPNADRIDAVSFSLPELYVAGLPHR